MGRIQVSLVDSLWWEDGSPAARALIGVGALAHLIREIPSARVGKSVDSSWARETASRGFGSPSRPF